MASLSPRADQVTGLDRLGLVFALLALLLPILGSLADKSVVLLAIAAALAGGITSGSVALPWRIVARRPALLAAALLTWCLVSSAWSPGPLPAAGLALRIAALLAALLYVVALADLLREEQSQRVCWAFAIGFFLTVGLLLIELLFGSPIFNFLNGAASNEYATYSRLNRGVSTLAILVWPLTAFVWFQGWQRVALTMALGLLVITLFSESSASVLGLAAAIPAAGLSLLGRGPARMVMAIALIFTLFGSAFVGPFAQRSGLAQATWLPHTAQF